MLAGEERGREFVALAAGASLAAWTPERTLILPEEGEPRLYVKPDDRCEVNDVRQHEIDRAEAIEAELRAFIAAPSASARPRPASAG